MVKNCKIVKNCQHCPNLSQIMSPRHSDQMFQRSQVSWVALCMSKVIVLSESVSLVIPTAIYGGVATQSKPWFHRDHNKHWWTPSFSYQKWSFLPIYAQFSVLKLWFFSLQVIKYTKNKPDFWGGGGGVRVLWYHPFKRVDSTKRKNC